MVNHRLNDGPCSTAILRLLPSGNFLGKGAKSLPNSALCRGVRWSLAKPARPPRSRHGLSWAVDCKGCIFKVAYKPRITWYLDNLYIYIYLDLYLDYIYIYISWLYDVISCSIMLIYIYIYDVLSPKSTQTWTKCALSDFVGSLTLLDFIGFPRT